MSVLEQCQRETIRLATEHGTTPIPAWRYGDLACHDGIAAELGRWCITHLPTGLSFNTVGNFLNTEDACRAMIAVSRVSNNWALIERDDLRRLGEASLQIFEEHGAVSCKSTEAHLKRLRKFSDRQFDQRINGYEQTGKSA